MTRYIIISVLIIFYATIIFGIGVTAGNNEGFNKSINNFLERINSALSQEEEGAIDDSITVWVDDKSKKHDGLIIIGSGFINNPAIILTDSNGEIIHKWNVEKKISNPDMVNLHEKPSKDLKDTVHGINDTILFPNGDVIFTHTYLEFASLRSQRIARMDKDSKIIWEIPGLFHHDIILAEDGNIYSVGSKLSDTIPSIDNINDDSLKFVTGLVQIISTDGKLLKSISIEDAFVDSGFEYMLPLFNIDITAQDFELKDGTQVYDPIHLNSVDYINAKQAKILPFAEAGDLLISMRGNSSIAILRPSINKIVWATRGPWKNQHYVRLTDEGKITIYDNEGGSFISKDEEGEIKIVKNPRIVEFDPITRKIKILFHKKTERNISSYWRGYYKKLDGNKGMIISSPNSGRVMQVDNNGNTVWELRTTKDREESSINYTKKIFAVKYYEKNYIKFLDCVGCTNNQQ